MTAVNMNPTTCCRETVVTSCCPSNPIARRLTATLSGCISKTVKLTYVDASEKWIGYFTAGACQEELQMACGGSNNWYVALIDMVGGDCYQCEGNDNSPTVDCAAFEAQA